MPPAPSRTDDGSTYDYVYDAFNRLKIVKTQAGVTVAEYRYNGLNQRIGWHYDIDADADTDSSDNWIYFVNDDRWRIVTTWRGNGAGTTLESNPKERFIFHAAGAGGRGGSSYIDSVILRDRDNTSGWNSASDNTLEERRYYIQNWRADVVAMISDTKTSIERVKYSAYGVPFNFPMGDTDCDGDTDTTDVNQINTWIGIVYNVLGDTDLDGDVDLTDKNNANAAKITTGRGLLSYSGLQNRIGYAGYQHVRELMGDKWHVRNRLLFSNTGRWTARDPISYAGGPSLYQYANSRPVVGSDPMGTDFYDPGNPDQHYRPNCREVCETTSVPLGPRSIRPDGWNPEVRSCRLKFCDPVQTTTTCVTECTLPNGSTYRINLRFSLKFSDGCQSVRGTPRDGTCCIQMPGWCRMCMSPGGSPIEWFPGQNPPCSEERDPHRPEHEYPGDVEPNWRDGQGPRPSGPPPAGGGASTFGGQAHGGMAAE